MAREASGEVKDTLTKGTIMNFRTKLSGENIFANKKTEVQGFE
jgi:hypothetical protein